MKAPAVSDTAPLHCGYGVGGLLKNHRTDYDSPWACRSLLRLLFEPATTAATAGEFELDLRYL